MTLFGLTLDFNAKSLARVERAIDTSCPATLCDIRPGEQAVIRSFAPGLSPERLAQLQSYGLTPGRIVRVVQHSPVTVIQVEHCELALEDELARLVEIS